MAGEEKDTTREKSLGDCAGTQFLLGPVSLSGGMYSQADIIHSFLLHYTMYCLPPHPLGSPRMCLICNPYSSLLRWPVPGLESWLHPLLILCPWTSSLIPQSLSFLISKYQALKVVLKVEYGNPHKVFSMVSVT